MSACLLPVWPGHVYFWFVIFWSLEWCLGVSAAQCVARLLKLLFVCVLECLGYVAQLFGCYRNSLRNAGSRCKFIGVVWTWLTNVIGGCFQMFCLYSAHQWPVTLAFGCGLCSTSFSGGHQVDGLQPVLYTYTLLNIKS